MLFSFHPKTPTYTGIIPYIPLRRHLYLAAQNRETGLIGTAGDMQKPRA